MRTLKMYLASTLLLLGLMMTFLSCEKDVIPLPEGDDSILAFSAYADIDPPSGAGATVLGEELLNPYDLTMMNDAYDLLMGEPGNLQPTHYYLRLLPQTGEQVMAIADYEDEYGYEFETQPIHFEVTYQGDEDYRDPTLADDVLSPEYGAITADHFTGGRLPEGVPYEVIQPMNIPIYESRLTFTAFVISGNEKYYEAVDGLCHPDCPTWPSCLDDADLTCVSLPSPNGQTVALQTINPFSDDDRINFPDYIKDTKLGYLGEVDFLPNRLHNTTSGNFPGSGPGETASFDEEPNCGAGCIPILVAINNPFPDFEWICDCDPPPGEGDGGSTTDDPPAGQVERCDCFVYADSRKPGGRIALADTQLGEEGVRRVKVKTTKHHWGFIWRNTDTDDRGCWKIDTRYNVRRAKTKVVFKDRVSDRITIRSFRGIRFWNATIKPAKYNWRLRQNNRVWNEQCLVIYDDADNTSKKEQTFIAATTNNAYHEFFDDHSSLAAPAGRVRILIHTLGGRLAAAPMFHRMDADQINIADIGQWAIAYANPVTAAVLGYLDLTKPDMFIPFGEDDLSDAIKRLIYHETAHVAQYVRFGPQWWDGYVDYLVATSFTGQAKPYGDGSSPNAGRAELTEGMAESLENYMADLQYGLSHSRMGNSQNRRYMNVGESLLFWRNEDLPANSDFIPEGLYFDLWDVNQQFPITRPEQNNISDNVTGFSYEQLYDAFNPLVFDVDQYRDVLWGLHGINNPLTTEQDYLNLFNSYGH